MPKENVDEESMIEGPAQLAVIVPIIPVYENEPVRIEPFTAQLRDELVDLLMKHSLMYRGIAVKIMSGRIPEVMRKEMLELREEHREAFLKDRGEAVKERRASKRDEKGFVKRVRKGWGSMWRI
jgi:hypothetical protein